MKGNCAGAKGMYGESCWLSVVLPVSFWVLLTLYKTLVGVETAQLLLLLISFQVN